jgi:hypothetical protein
MNSGPHLVHKNMKYSNESLCAVLSFRNVLQVGTHLYIFNLSFSAHGWLLLFGSWLLSMFYSDAPCEQAMFISVMMTLNL